MTAPDYRAFLEAKVRMAPSTGFDVPEDIINPALRPHTRALVRWAVRGGRRAIFASFGLHKTATQIEVCRILKTKVAGPALIVLPLGVRQEFTREVAERFAGAFAVRLKFIRRPDEVEVEGPDGVPVIHLTNYETIRDGKLDPNLFAIASLDEASVLRSFGSKTYQSFLALFDQVRFRFVATATPSPNRFKELIHYGGFLGVMDTGQALTRFFQRNAESAGDLTLYPHKEREFFLWLNSWAAFVTKPSDLGFSDEGYALPPLAIRFHEVETELVSREVERDGQGVLLKVGARGLAEEARERRDTLPARIAKLADIIAADPDSHRIIWHDLEAERHAIDAAVPGAVAVYGSQDLDAREAAIVAFSDGRFRHLSAKPVIAGSGCNFQRHCHKAVFVGVSHKFNDFIQAVHRIQRFGQSSPVEIDIIHAESEREVVRDLQAKWARHEELQNRMSEIIREHGLDTLSMSGALTRTIGVARQEAMGEGWLVANNDCVEECRTMPASSVDLIVTSIPFSNQYEYTPSYNDFGHTESDAQFFAQLDFLTPELLRVLAPGRIAAIHVKDRILFGSVTGLGRPAVSPFHASCIFHYMRHGFVYCGMITVNTDVVRENNQTYRLGYSEMCKDGSRMSVGMPEYILLFFKPQTDRSVGYADERVTKARDEYSLARWQIDAHAFWRSSGDRLLTPDELASMGPDRLAKVFTAESLKAVYDHEGHVRVGEALQVRGALPSTFMALQPGAHDPDTWHDVVRMRTLNALQASGNREKHVCPLQFDIVDRLIRRYTNEGETVFDPFGGLFTVPYRALALKRRGRAVELSDTYYADGLRYLRAIEAQMAVPTLFGALDETEEAA